MSRKHHNERDKKMKGWFMKEQNPLISLFSYSSPLLRVFFSHSQFGADLFDAIYITVWAVQTHNAEYVSMPPIIYQSEIQKQIFCTKKQNVLWWPLKYYIERDDIKY